MYTSMRRAALLRSALRRRPLARRRPPLSAPLLRAPSSNAAAKVRDAQLEEATAFVVRVGAVREGKTYSRDVAEGVVAALADPASGVPLSALLPTLKQLAGAYEIGEDNGLDALAAAVEREVNERAGKQGTGTRGSAISELRDSPGTCHRFCRLSCSLGVYQQNSAFSLCSCS